jgi:beta-barrel assembly-enhancing protease
LPISRKSFYIVLILMLACGAAVSIGQLDPDVSLDSAREIWADALRDADQFGLQATRVSAATEMQLGAQMASQAGNWGPEDPEDAKYVNAVARLLELHVHRKGIEYHFHVIRSPEINAFALPGGQIYVLSGMFDLLESEAELAAVLGHEMSHVDLRHCIERYQYELALEKVGAGQAGAIVGFAHRLVAIGYTQYQELEADASGERLAIESGYDPDAAAAVFKRMQVKFGDAAAPRAIKPAGEVGQAVEEAIGSYFQTHPSSEERSRQLSAMAGRNRQKLAGQIVYKGVENYRKRIPRSAQEFPAERRAY